MANDKHTAEQVVAWLLSLDTVTAATPVVVTIAGKAYIGARYQQVVEGVGGPHSEGKFYLLGEHPSKIKGRRNFCFPFADAEWFIACYYDDKKTEFQPFGANFCVCKWDAHDGQKIDAHEICAYLRVPMTVEGL